MASKATTARYGATSTSQLINVSDFYEQYVRGDLLDGDANHIPILRTDALKYLVLFRNQLTPNFIIECFCGKNNQHDNSIIRLLSSEHILLHHYVGYAVERLLLMKTSDGQPMLTSNNIPVRALIDALFDCSTGPLLIAPHYIMKALMRCFNIIDPVTASIAHIYSLCVLIRKAYTKVEGGLDKHVIRIIELIIPKDVVDLVLMLYNHSGVTWFPTANAFLNHIDVNEKMTSRNILLPMLNRMQQLKTAKYSRQLVLFLCRLESIQQGIFLMVMEKIMVAELKTMHQVHTYEEKRIITIGVAAIIKDTSCAWPALWRSGREHSGDLEAFDHRKTSNGGEGSANQPEVDANLDDQYAEMNEIEYSDPTANCPMLNTLMVWQASQQHQSLPG
uniref:Exportin-2 central domain-containing protein n=1 Tax=Ditylenchus dipsaci TaxID=166011 RepID=A0A915EKA4_9BILA